MTGLRLASPPPGLDGDTTGLAVRVLWLVAAVVVLWRLLR